MIDPELERQYHDCEELLTYWQNFHEYYDMAIAGKGLTPENEENFLQIKSRIAMLTDSFIDALKDEDQETLVAGQGIQKIVETSITLKILSKMDFATVRKAQLEWNESYILLTDTIGKLSNKREELSHISATQANLAKIGGTISQKTTAFLKSGGFKLAIFGGIVGAILFVVFYVGLIHKLGDIGPARPFYNLVIDVVYRSVQPDYPWKSVDHLAPGSWKMGSRYNEPVESGEKDADVYAALQNRMGDPSFVNGLKADAVEFKAFKAETAQTGLAQKFAKYYLIRLKDTKTANDLADKWVEIVKARPAANIEDKYRIIHNKHYGNVLLIIYAEDKDVANDMVVKVFGIE